MIKIFWSKIYFPPLIVLVAYAVILEILYLLLNYLAVPLQLDTYLGLMEKNACKAGFHWISFLSPEERSINFGS